MKAVRIHDYKAPVTVETAPDPDLGAGEVLVRVAAGSLNPLDTKLQSGAMQAFFPLAFPFTVGTDLAGVVERAGAEAQSWRAGDRVVGRLDPTRGGALAQYAAVPAAQVAAVPQAADLNEAAGVPTAAGTAWQALFETADLKAGQTVLVHAGAGGVGSFAVQFARNAGAHVVATASGAGIEVARQLGAHEVVDYRSERFEDKVHGVDVVFDTVGGETQERSYAVVRAGGALLTIASPINEALAKAHGVVATFVFHRSDGARLGRIMEMIAAGTVTVLIDRKVPLSDVAEAFAHQASGRARGKIIVTLD